MGKCPNIRSSSRRRDEAIDRLEETAADAGADAVLGLRFQGTEVVDGVTEILAYGTAVTLE